MTGDELHVMMRPWMQPVDKYKLALGILWSLFTLYGISLLFPPMDRRLREWEARYKPGRFNRIFATPTRLQRVVFILLTSLMTAVAFASAFHRELGELTRFGAPRIVSLMLILPALYFALGMLNQRRKNRQKPEADLG